MSLQQLKSKASLISQKISTLQEELSILNSQIQKLEQASFKKGMQVMCKFSSIGCYHFEKVEIIEIHGDYASIMVDGKHQLIVSFDRLSCI